MGNTCLMTLVEVADLLRISPHTVRAMVRAKRLKPVRICRRLLFSTDEVDRLIAAATVGNSTDIVEATNNAGF
jgi:excisionase family DNA binding protein